MTKKDQEAAAVQAYRAAARALAKARADVVVAALSAKAEGDAAQNIWKAALMVQIKALKRCRGLFGEGRCHDLFRGEGWDTERQQGGGGRLRAGERPNASA